MGRTVALSILDRIEIASPCHASWEKMAGDDRSRFCGECRLNVYNIAAMTRSEAEALILEKEGHLCARIFRRADGTVLTRDCPVGIRALRRRAAAGLARVGAACAMMLGVLLTLAGARGAGLRARQMKPFSTICEWVSPAPPTVTGAVAGGLRYIPPPPTTGKLPPSGTN